MKQIHIKFNSDRTADFSIGNGQQSQEVKLDGCYRADIINVPEQLFQYSPEQRQLAEKKGIQLPELDSVSHDEVGKFLVLYFCKEFHPFGHPALPYLIKIPDQTIKSLNDVLGQFGLTGIKCGRSYTQYFDDQYAVRLTEGVQVLTE